MTIPYIPNYSGIWVRGKFVDLAKAARNEEFYGVGQPVIFTPSPKVLINQGTGQIISTGPFRVDTSKTDGSFSIFLPATNDPDIIPFDFTYKVSEPSGRTAYDVKLAIDTPYLDEPGNPLHGQRVVDLVSIVPAPSPSSGTVQLLSGRGVWDVWINGANELEGEYTDGVLFNAGVVSVGSVNGQTGTVALNKSHIGLGNVDNTADSAKPVSTAQSSAISAARTAAEGTAATALTGHVNASDPHSTYYNQTRGDARYRKITDPVTVPAVGTGTSAARFVGRIASAPSATGFSTGDIVFRTDTKTWLWFNGTAWV